MKDARSRGALPVDFLRGQQTPQQYVEGLSLEVLLLPATQTPAHVAAVAARGKGGKGGGVTF